MKPQIAIVTGGSRGLGRSAALALARKGIHVILTYQSRADAAAEVVVEAKKAGVDAHALRLDASKSATFAGFASEVKTILQEKWNRGNFDFLINNAGIGIHAPFAETTEEQFDMLMNIHLKGVFFLTQRLLPLLSDGGRIINLSSGLARFSFPGYSAYATMKGAVETLSRYLAKELGPRGIAVNVVAPGAIETDFAGGQVRDNEQINALIASQTALGRVGLPDDIGGVIASLCLPETRWINAQRIEASGGMMI